MGLPSVIELGFVASGHSAVQTTTVRLRDLSDVAGGVTRATFRPMESPGPSSRKAPFAITEIMFKPAPRTDGKQLEFIEIFNANPFPEDIGHYRLSGDVDYEFPANTSMAGGSFLVLAKVPADVEAYYGLSGVLGYGRVQLETNTINGSSVVTTNVANSLNGSGGTLRLVNSSGGVILEIPYSNKAPWPAGAHATGHSLVLARPSYGEGDARAWAISDSVDGSPGRLDPYWADPRRSVVINEFMAGDNASAAAGFIELYNHSNQPADLSGCLLTDDPMVGKFPIPQGTVLPGGGFAKFDASQLGFAIDPAGGLLFLVTPEQARFLDVVRYEGQAEGVAFGRFPDGAGELYSLTTPTPGAGNAPIRISDVVINEIMFAPITRQADDQYIELYNQGANLVDLSGWRFTSGVDFTFPANTTLAPDSYLVVARSVTNLLARYPYLTLDRTLGNFTGKLSGKGERVALARPVNVGTNVIYALEDEVSYETGGQWPHWAAHGGSSLELVDPQANHRLAANWADSDETAKASWTTIEATGTMDNGLGSANAVEGGMLEEGECLVDDVEVVAASNPANLVANPGFDSGITSWSVRGNHVRSSLEPNLGTDGSPCLHVRASSRCDYGPNRIYGRLQGTPSGTVTIRAKVRWLKGWPEFLLRLHGNSMEATGPLAVPRNLGTPGLPNSRRSLSGPSIRLVKPVPVLPAAGAPMVVTASIEAPHGLSGVSLRYRVDPATSYTTVPMLDNGSGGDAVANDGIYSATIPGQAGGTLVAFTIQAQGQDASNATTSYPANTPENGIQRECLVRFGEPDSPTAFGTYHQWFTQQTVDAWVNRPYLSNEMLEGTFVYGDERVIYDFGARIAGSPWHQGSPGQAPSPTSDLHYTLQMPGDDLLLGTDNFNKIHAPGNGAFDDDTLQREQTGYWIARQMRLPWTYRRFVNMFVNGSRRRDNALMEDMQVPGPDVLAEYFPNDNNGHLYKNQCWFEMDDGVSGGMPNSGNASWCTLNKYTSASSDIPGQFKLARYRWNWFARAAERSANEYADVFALIDAANSPAGQLLTDRVQAVADVEEWMRTWAVRHSLGDWDFFGSQNAQNSYSYKPDYGRWQVFVFDMNIILGNSGSWGPGQNLFTVNSSQPGDPVMAKLYAHPPFRRMYLRALKEICLGAMVDINVNPILDAKYQAFLNDGLRPQSPASVKSWIAGARTSILNTVASQEAAAFSVTTPTPLDSTSSPVTLTGEAPVSISAIRVNGVEYPVSWTSVKAWSVQIPVRPGTTSLVISGYDLQGQPLTNALANVEVRYTGPDRTFTGVSINEWMASNRSSVADPADGNYDDWFELYNSNSVSVDLSGCFFSRSLTNRSEFQVPPGYTVPAQGYLRIWADNQPEQNTPATTDLHVNFRLNKSGADVGLFTPDGGVIDFVSFGPQSADVSQGRYPDGNATLYFMSPATAGSANRLAPGGALPVFQPISVQAVNAGEAFHYTAVAQATGLLTYSLDSRGPAGVAIDAGSGELSWVPTLAQASTTNVFQVYAADALQPQSPAATLITVVVRPAALRIETATYLNGQLLMSWESEPGQTYHIVYKNALTDPQWTDTGGSVTGTGGSAVYTVDLPSVGNRYYRLLLGSQ
jgi:hypothetical protein